MRQRAAIALRVVIINGSETSACDGVVTGIQRRAPAGDIDGYRSIKKPLKNRYGCNLF
jgi:hypothetical protein